MKKKEKLDVKKLSIATRQAMEDMISCERSSKYRINMAHYHRPVFTGRLIKKLKHCIVCFAGATIVRRTDKRDNRFIGPFDCKREEHMLCALDYIRRGKLNTAGCLIRYSDTRRNKLTALEKTSENAKWLKKRGNSYKKNSRQFKKRLLALADELEELGM